MIQHIVYIFRENKCVLTEDFHLTLYSNETIYIPAGYEFGEFLLPNALQLVIDTTTMPHIKAIACYNWLIDTGYDKQEAANKLVEILKGHCVGYFQRHLLCLIARVKGFISYPADAGRARYLKQAQANAIEISGKEFIYVL